MTTEAYRNPYVVADAAPAERAGFIRRTYAHLGGAIAAFIAIEYLLFQTVLPNKSLEWLSTGRYSWLIVLGGFMAVSWIADHWARSSTAPAVQYAGLGLYVVAEALIFVPLLAIANRMAPDIIPMAGLITLLLFGGLTFTAFTTRKDFSFLGSILKIGSFVALGVIIAGAVFGFQLGLLFSGVMVAFAAGAILYSTSNIIHHYGTTQHVAAALSLFASVALLFWYILRILMSLSRRD